jgi:shikimate dehydrogenase
VLLGHHIGYSASPAMHNAAFEALGMDARYELADVRADGLADAVAALRRPGSIGANVTQPHKLAVCDFVDEVTPPVERLGAANTIVNQEGRLVAHNTDLPAVAAELGRLGALRRAVVLGNGGASRAVQAALAEAGVDTTVVDRERWTELSSLLADASLLVNATPIGTGSNDTPVSSDLLRPDLAVLDLVYRPTPTRLVREARAAGALAEGGAGMLLTQAVMSFELWTDRQAPVAAMDGALTAELAAVRDA